MLASFFMQILKLQSTINFNDCSSPEIVDEVSSIACQIIALYSKTNSKMIWLLLMLVLLQNLVILSQIEQVTNQDSWFALNELLKQLAAKISDFCLNIPQNLKVLLAPVLNTSSDAVSNLHKTQLINIILSILNFVQDKNIICCTVEDLSVSSSEHQDENSVLRFNKEFGASLTVEMKFLNGDDQSQIYVQVIFFLN